MFQIFFAYVGKDSFVHQVLETCLKVTVKECVAQYPSGMIIAASALIYFSNTILSQVSVPVLSVQRMFMAPKFWMALRFFTTVFFFDIDTAPFERFAVTIIGSISGVNPTATDKANMNASKPIAFCETVDKEDEWNHHQHKAYQ